jgi:hypothetical protein
MVLSKQEVLSASRQSKLVLAVGVRLISIAKSSLRCAELVKVLVMADSLDAARTRWQRAVVHEQKFSQSGSEERICSRE